MVIFTPLEKKGLQFQGHINFKPHCAQFSYFDPPSCQAMQAINYRPFQGSSSRPPQWSRRNAVCSFYSKPRETCRANKSQWNLCSMKQHVKRGERKIEARVYRINKASSIYVALSTLTFFLVEATWIWRADCRRGCGSARPDEMWYPKREKRETRHPEWFAALFAYRVNRALSYWAR